MTRFIVEEGGKRRAFKAVEGVVSIGSGERAMLKLASSGVAEVHAEFELRDGVVRLRLKPGVVPPQIGGRPAQNEQLLAHGTTLAIGDATITLASDEGPLPSAAQASGARTAGAPVRVGARASGAPSAPAQAKLAPREKQTWERSAREVHKDKGIKPLHMLLLLIPVGVIAFFFLKRGASQKIDDSLSGPQQVFLAERAAQETVWDQAEQALSKIGDRSKLSTDLQARANEVERKIKEGRAAGAVAANNSGGDKYLQSQLKNFEEQRLAGSKVDRSVVRVFLKRVAEFERRWPNHPDMDWVRRKKERYGPMVDLTKPGSYADIEFEVKSMTWDNPRNYREAFGVLNRWLEVSLGDERGKGLALLDKLIKEREEWFEDRLQEAAHQYKKGQLGQSIQWLCVLITYSGDDAMGERAAEDLIKFHGSEAPTGGTIDLRVQLRGYRRELPDYWKVMEANRTLAAWMREHPIDA
ncbi:MAG: hypothetical protein FJ298_13885 [Planctomycetes bacterium]|nr:hypothetical protein [Planctomycetota bacterium]